MTDASRRNLVAIARCDETMRAARHATEARRDRRVLGTGRHRSMTDASRRNLVAIARCDETIRAA